MMLDGMDGLEMEELEFQSGSEVDGAVDCFVLAVSFFAAKEFLLAMPCDALPQEMVDAGSLEDSTGIFGPSCREWFRTTVSWLLQEKISRCSSSTVQKEFHLYSAVFGLGEELAFGFNKDHPIALPSLDGLLAEAEKWASGRSSFYIAESAAETAVESPKAVVLPKRQQRRPGGGEGIPSATGMAKPKRMTTAALASSVESLITAIPRLTDQPQMLADRQQAIEDHVAGARLPPRAQLAKPLQESFSLSALYSKVSVFSTSNCSTANYGFASSSDREARGCPGVGGQNQSDELTTLVSEIAAAGQDPLNDLAGAGSSV